MRHSFTSLLLLIGVFSWQTVLADVDDRSGREQAAERYMATFCVTDVGLRGRGGILQADGTVHFSHLVMLDRKRMVQREYDVSRDEMHAVWRDAYAEALTVEELDVLAGFCRPDNSPLRTALRKQRNKASARMFRAIMKTEVPRNPTLAPFESAFEMLERNPQYELSQEEAKALAELRESDVAQSATEKIDMVVYKRVDQKLWKIGEERGVDTPRP